MFDQDRTYQCADNKCYIKAGKKETKSSATMSFASMCTNISLVGSEHGRASKSIENNSYNEDWQRTKYTSKKIQESCNNIKYFTQSYNGFSVRMVV